MASQGSRLSYELAEPPTRYDASNLPAEIDRVADIDIPRRVWSALIIDGVPREIVRPLTLDERCALEVRVARLAPAMRPFSELDADSVAQALADMYSSFPSMRHAGADALGRVDTAMRVALVNFPAWAIEEACRSIQVNGYERCEDGRCWIEKNWPPSDAGIVVVVERIVKRRADALKQAKDLLAAPVEPRIEQRRLTREEIEAKIGRKLTVPGGDGKHMERVNAELAARKAAREAQA